eukprot:EG_transcript_8554
MKVKVSIFRFWTNLKIGLALADRKKLALYSGAGLATGLTGVSLLMAHDCESVFYDGILFPLLRRLEPETLHRLCINAAKWGICPFDRSGDLGRMEKALAIGVCGMVMSSPIGLAAGVDSSAEAFDRLFRLGVSHVEVGSVTPDPQAGNPRPRQFLLEPDGAVVYRAGQPNDGLVVTKERLQKRMKKLDGGVVGVNLAPNAQSATVVEDFVRGIQELGPNADYLVLNLTAPEEGPWHEYRFGPKLHALLKAARVARDGLPGDWVPPLMVKVSADLTPREQLQVALAVVNFDIDGIVVGGGTQDRPAGMLSPQQKEAGLLCGRPCTAKTNQCIQNLYRYTRGHVPIIASGGVLSSLDAYNAIRSGACLVQLHSALALQGPGVVPRMRRNLWKRLKEDGFHAVGDAIGADVHFEEPARRPWWRWLW